MNLLSMLSKNRKEIHFGKDIFAGVVIALVSIPISMGYAQIAGLPAVFGLYGSILPIFVFGLITSSRQFVVGVDAMPAVMVGSMLAELGIVAESREALSFVPVIAMVVALWFILFAVFRFGRIVKYISMPVMGGFISGVGCTIILMQLPKLFGGNPGVGNVIQLVDNIVEEAGHFHQLSFWLGLGTTLVILICRRLCPRIPMTAVLLVVGGLIQVVCKVDTYGVKLLPEVAKGLPQFALPDMTIIAEHPQLIFTQSFSIAIVIMAQTLLASGNYAIKYGDKLNHNRELVAYAAMNAASGIVGCCPVNGSVSRSGITDSFGCRSQLMSVAAAVTMLLILLFATPLLSYLPVPVLTGIVMAALVGILEMKMAGRLWKIRKNEFMIFMISFFGVLFLGTVGGVVVGTILSFCEVAIRATAPPTALVGRIPGQGNFYSLGRNSNARPIKNVVIYRFGGNLFFANIDRFQNDIARAVKEDTKCIVVDARGISSIDITAIDRLIVMARNYMKQGIRFYITEHEGSLNDAIRSLGGATLIEENHVRRTITLALRDAGFEKPYELEESGQVGAVAEPDEELEKLVEVEWAFGVDAEKWLERLASEEARLIEQELHETETLGEVVQDISYTEIVNKIFGQARLHTIWGMLGRFDENEFWDYLEIKLEELSVTKKITPEELVSLEREIEVRRMESEEHLRAMGSSALDRLREHRRELRKRMRAQHPEAYAHMDSLHKKLYGELKKKNPKLAEAIKELHEK